MPRVFEPTQRPFCISFNPLIVHGISLAMRSPINEGYENLGFLNLVDEALRIDQNLLGLLDFLAMTMGA